MKSFGVAALALFGAVGAQNTATAASDVYAAQATARTDSPTSHHRGKAFDHFVTIWLENTDFDKAAGDPNLKFFAEKGITLSNYFGVTHPSEPNYVAAIGGDYFGMNNDAFNAIPQNVSTVIDLLEAKGISWSEYQEDMPYTGFEGMAWVNQTTQENDYVRKHNPAVIYDSVAKKADRLARIKNTTMFATDLAHNKLPQWSFITPNMKSDGHDTSVTYAGTWVRNFLEPLLKNKHFMKRTLVLITFDENHTYTQQNRVFSILLGDAVPEHLVGTTDDSFYNHYSEIATVEANWGLHTLGRWDVGANVFKFVGEETEDEIRSWDEVTGPNPSVFLNESYAGMFNNKLAPVPFPAPDIFAFRRFRTVLPEIIFTWVSEFGNSIYNCGVEIPDAMHPPKGY